MDLLTEVFSTLRPTGVLYAKIEALAPWGLDFEVRDVVKFCLLTRGGAYLTLSGQEPIPLQAGDFVLTTGGAKYTLQDQPESVVVPIEEVVQRPGRGVSELIRIGQTGSTTMLLNGLMAFEEPDGAYFLKLLPQWLIIRREQAERFGFAIYLERLIFEAQAATPGAQLVANWLAGILFVHAVRAYIFSGDYLPSGWLGALSDRQISAALCAMHARVAQRWTVQEMAKEAGMSRSGFAKRFVEKVGQPPLDYLTAWRMHLALSLLKRADLKLAVVAARLGYESDTAFAKVFKKRYGMTPSRYRTMKLI